MKIIKLNAISSTNDFLKEMALNMNLVEFTIVHTQYQTNGKGQMHSSWHSKRGKNLLFSVLVRNNNLKLLNGFALNMAASISVFSVLSKMAPDIKIKWPNDIMASNKKIAGILIENIVQGSKIKQSIIGFGININQKYFPVNLSKATSLKLVTNKTYNLETIRDEIVIVLKTELLKLKNDSIIELKNRYLLNLFRLNQPAAFKFADKIFMGKIKGISNEGKLIIVSEDGYIKSFEIKEIEFL